MNKQLLPDDICPWTSYFSKLTLIAWRHFFSASESYKNLLISTVIYHSNFRTKRLTKYRNGKFRIPNITSIEISILCMNSIIYLQLNKIQLWMYLNLELNKTQQKLISVLYSIVFFYHTIYLIFDQMKFSTKYGKKIIIHHASFFYSLF